MLSAAAVLFVAIGLLATAGCGGGGQRPPAAEALVREAARATGRARSFHFVLDVQGVPTASRGLQLTSAEGDVIAPDRARAEVGGTFSGVPVTTEIVAIGEKVWLQSPLSASWQAIDVETTPVALLDPSSGVLGVMKSISGARDEGSEEVDGLKLRKVSGVAAAAEVAPLVAVSPSQRQVPVVLWIGEDDHLLRRIELSGPVARGEPADAKRVVDLSRFDEPVSIEAPEGSG